MADSKIYFIFHIDVYQIKNISNIDFDICLYKFPTNQKGVANSIVHSGIFNYSYGSSHLFIYNRYSAPRFFSLMVTIYDIQFVGTFKFRSKGFTSDKIHLDKKY